VWQDQNPKEVRRDMPCVKTDSNLLTFLPHSLVNLAAMIEAAVSLRGS
jgi:hypothetical protein